MLSRLVTTGMIVFTGVQSLAAADPLVPPAPPAPQLNLPAAPIPESHAVPPVTPPQDSIPQPSIPPSSNARPPVVSPSGSDPYALPSTSNIVPGGVIAVPPVASPSAPIQSAPLQAFPFQSVPGTATYILQPDGTYVLSGDNAFPGGDPYLGTPRYNSFSTGYDQQRYVSGPGGSEHARYPYYSYRRPWYSPGPVSRNVNIIW